LLLPSPELLAVLWTIAADKLTSGDSFFILRKNLQDFERRISATADEELFTPASQNARESIGRAVCGPSCAYFQFPSAELGVRPRPRLKSSKTIVNLSGGTREIYNSIFFP
jgi:hypothetical protein